MRDYRFNVEVRHRNGQVSLKSAGFWDQHVVCQLEAVLLTQSKLAFCVVTTIKNRLRSGSETASATEQICVRNP